MLKVDDSSLSFRTRNDPPAGGQGRSYDGAMLMKGALEPGDGDTPGRPRLSDMSSYEAVDIGQFIETAAASNAAI